MPQVKHISSNPKLLQKKPNMNQSTESAFYVGELSKSPSLMIGVVILSITSAFFYSVVNDFLQTFLKRPAHFLPSKISQRVRTPKVNVPLVELRDDGNYRELLARGSKQVFRHSFNDI